MLHFKVPTVQMYSFAPSVRIIVILSNSFTPGQKPKIMPVQPYIYMFKICMLYAKTMYYLIWAQCNNKRCFNSLNESLQSFSHREPNRDIQKCSVTHSVLTNGPGKSKSSLRNQITELPKEPNQTTESPLVAGKNHTLLTYQNISSSFFS